LLDIRGLAPISARTSPERPILQWRVDGRVVETDFSRFRPVRMFEVPPQSALRVVWQDFADEPMGAPFFKHVIETANARQDRSDQFETDWEVVRRVAAQPGNLPLSGTVFHMARTGSTLIHRLLNASGLVLSLSEVGITDRMMQLTADWPEDRRGPIVRDTVAVYGQPRRPAETHYVLKMTDATANTHLRSFRAALPETPWVFVYRDPVEVMVSMIRRPTGTIGSWMHNRSRGARRLRMPGLADPALWPADFIARTLRRHCTIAAEVARATPPGKFLAVNYNRLPEAVWETIAPHFGITLTARERERMQAEARFSSKRRDEVEFTPDSKKKHEDAKPWVRELAERMVVPAVDELRSLPQA
jgi:hypothetical protein